MYDQEPRKRRAFVALTADASSTPRLTAPPPLRVMGSALKGVRPATWMSVQSRWNGVPLKVTRSSRHDRRRPIS